MAWRETIGRIVFRPAKEQCHENPALNLALTEMFKAAAEDAKTKARLERAEAVLREIAYAQGPYEWAGQWLADDMRGKARAYFAEQERTDG